ncbi:MAG: hypothetical protein ABL958_02590 [Bdellovibrionia bacterium]
MDEILKTKRGNLLVSLATQNMTLKVCLIGSGAVCAVLLFGLLALAFKDPLVVGLSESGPKVLSKVGNSNELDGPEVRAFINDLLGRKFARKPTNENQLQVCDFFTEGPRASCQKSIKDQKSFVPQDFIVNELIWNSRTETANLTLKRFANFNGALSSVEGLVALKLTRRSRTANNPWGIFVESWKEDLKQ